MIEHKYISIETEPEKIMIDYFDICMIILLNFIIYMGTHLFLEFYYRQKSDDERASDSKPKAWSNSLVLFFTVLPSLYLWILFVLIPFSAFLGGEFFYNFILIINLEKFSNIVQFLGIIFIFLATIIAILGRIARGKYAISWGIPVKVVDDGIFKYIRHPLYSSYILYFIGFQLTFFSVLITPLLLGLVGYYWTAVYEENILISKFGDQYHMYKTKTKRFIPFLI